MALFHVFNTVENRTTGVPMAGVQVRAKFDDTEQIAPIYADQDGTAFDPENYCLTDADGMYSFYIDTGEYTLEYLIGDAVIKTILNFRPAEVGPTGPANSTFETTEELEIAATSNISAILAEVGKVGTFTTRDYTDFTAQVAADTGKVNYIRSVSEPTKVWVRTSILSDAAGKTGASSGLTVDDELAAKATLLGTGRTDTNMGTATAEVLPDNGTAKDWFETLGDIAGARSPWLYASRSEAEGANVPAPVKQIGVISGNHVLNYVRDASGTALETNDGALWSPADDVPTPAHFGATPSSPDAPAYIDAELDVFLEYVRATNAKEARIHPGFYFCQEPHTFPRNVRFYGMGALSNWRLGPSGGGFSDTNNFQGLATFIACGTGDKTHTLDWVTSGKQCGFDRTIPVADRVTDAAPFQTFEMFDGTNQDGTTTTAATAKPFSALISFDEGWGRIIMENIRVVPSCPGAGEVEGLGGYTVSDEVLPWADWDFGIFATNPWQTQMRNVQCVGYWRYGGHFSYGHFEDTAYGATLGGTPHGESGFYETCGFQGGLVVRAPDLHPVMAVGATTASIRFTPSLRFPRGAGTFYASASDSLAGLSKYSYTSATHDNTDPANPLLQFNGVTKDGGGASTIVVGAALVAVFAAGQTGTEFSNCILSDFAHATALDDAAAELNAPGLPGRPGYRAGLEISGAPMRSVRFNNCFMSPVGPLAVHMGIFYDGLFSGDCYAEGKPWKTTIAGGFESTRGAAFVAGPRSSYLSEVGSKGRVTYRVEGEFFNTGINMVPLRLPRSGARLETMTDVHNVTGVYSLADQYPVTGHTERATFPGKWLLDKIMDTAGVTWSAMVARFVGGTPLVELANAKVQISETYVRPGTTGEVSLGVATRRFLEANILTLFTDKIHLGSNTATPSITANAGSPEGVVTARIGSLCTDSTNGKLYVKATGTGNTGWVVAGTQT